MPTGNADATFTWTGPINWSVPGPQNTTTTGNLFGTFLTGGTISNYDGSTADGFSGDMLTLTDLLNTSMSVAGDRYVSFFKITGGYNIGAPMPVTISHDDGAAVYIDGIQQPGITSAETSEVTQGFTYPAGSHTFQVNYVEANGSPSVLSFAQPVPEPASWALMIVGVGAAGAMLRGQRKRAFA